MNEDYSAAENEVIEPVEHDATPDSQLDHDVPEAVQQAADEISGGSDEELQTDRPVPSNVKALLDSLGEEAPAEQVKPEEAAAPPAAEKPAVEKPADEDAEILEGVKSERGKNRITQVLAERKQLRQDLDEVKQMIVGTGMSAEQFAQTLEFGRLVNTGSEQDKRVALAMLDQQRAALAAELGEELPGVDLLAGHTDLQEAVENLEITRERAVELSRLRKREQEQRAIQQRQMESQRDQQQFAQTVQNAATTMETYLQSRAQEADHPVRLQAIKRHFSDPAKVQEFVQTYEPHQWLPAIKFMYDNVSVAAPRNTSQAQPLRSRPVSMGSPAPAGNSPMERVASFLDNL